MRIYPAMLLALLASACVATGQSEYARKRSEQDAAIYNVQLGVNYMQQGRLELAKEKIERALEQDPRSADVHTAMAMLQTRLNNQRKADEHYRAAIRLAPDDANAANNYGVFLCQRDEYEEALKYFLQAARNPLYRTPEAAYTNAGTCARRAKDVVRAEEYFRQALRANPRFAEALHQMADLSLAGGHLLPARAFVERYLHEAEATPAILWLGVQVERALESPEAARSYAQRLKSEFPTSVETRRLLESERDAG